jgi:hypothetical protein
VEVDTDKPVLVDKYLDRAIELDVDALCDKNGDVVIAGIMEHIEQAGIHSGETICVYGGAVVLKSSSCGGKRRCLEFFTRDCSQLRSFNLRSFNRATSCLGPWRR